MIALKEAFERDVSDDLCAIKEEIGEGPFNAGSGLKWDLTFRNVSTVSKRLGLLTIPCRRGFWSFPLYLNPLTKELFVLMRTQSRPCCTQAQTLSQLLTVIEPY